MQVYAVQPNMINGNRLTRSQNSSNGPAQGNSQVTFQSGMSKRESEDMKMQGRVLWCALAFVSSLVIAIAAVSH